MNAPNLPVAPQDPTPIVLLSVPNDSVVNGYKIWKHDFIKNLAIEETRVVDLKQNIKWKTPDNPKKRINDLFLPNFLLSIM